MSDVDARLAAMEQRLAAIEQALAAARAPPSSPAPVWPAAAAAQHPPAQHPPAVPKPPAAAAPGPSRSVDLEDLLGGRVLAWVGGIAVVVGVVFFLVMAVRRGWIDEPTRVVLAFAGSAALLAAGVYLYERRGQSEAAIAATAASLATLYASLTTATTVYELVDPTVGLLVAGLVGAVGAALAVRWQSAVVGWLGILGAIVAPVLVGAGTSSASLAFIAIALISAVAVCVWQRWSWLASGAFVLSAPQLVAWVDGAGGTWLPLAVVLAFWALYVVAAVGYELRVPVETLRPSSSLLLLSAAALAAAVGYGMVLQDEPAAVRTAWIIWFALAYVGLGAAGTRQRMSRDVAALMIAIGVGFSAIALGLALEGPALVVGWAAEAAILAYVGSRTGDRRSFLATGLFLALAAGHALSFDAPLDSLLYGVDGLADALIAVLCVAGAALLAARLYEIEPPQPRTWFAIAGAAALVYAPSLAIIDLAGAQRGVDPGQTPQVLLSAFWGVVGLGAVLAGLVRDVRPLRLAGLALLGAAVMKVFLYDLAELDGAFRALSFVALGLLLLASAFAYQRMREP